MAATAYATPLPIPERTGASAAIASVGVSLPTTIVRNEAIAERLGVAAHWIERRTGIRSRHIANPKERLADHATQAGRQALERAGVTATDLDLVLVATTTADELLPNAAPLVAHALGAKHAGAFDIGAACTGFLSALAVGAGQIEAGRARAALVVGADLMSRITDPDDRGTAAVFADGAGAIVMVASETAGGVGEVVLGCDGDGAEHIVVKRSPGVIRMQGHETFRAAVAGLSHATQKASKKAGVSLDEIDLFVYHQANRRILQAVAERLELPLERVVDCIDRFGNTCAATLPLALAYSESEGQLKPGDRVLLGAFGAGFTWGASILEWGAA